MENFIIFLKLIFLSNTILLTPIPVDLHNNQWVELELNKPLQAITGGASIQLRFSRQHKPFIGLKDHNEIWNAAEKNWPENMLEVELVDENGNKVILSRRAVGISKDYVYFGVEGDVPLPTDVNFNQLRIKSSQEIKNVEIFWQNCKH